MKRLPFFLLPAVCLLAVGPVNGSSEMPEGWFYRDVGPVARAGSASYSDAGLAMAASTSGFGDRQDAVGYYCRAFSGDGEIFAEVTSAGAGCAGGIMFRESLSADSKFVALVRDAAGKPVLCSRPAQTRRGAGDPPPKSTYLKLERRGDTFSAYQSADACAWSLVGRCVLSMDSSLYAGTCAQGTVLVSGLETRELPLSGLVLWLRGDRVAEGNENKPVGIWKDQSGSGNDATQELASARPVWIPDGGAVRFGGNDFLNLTGNLPSLFSAECVVVFKLRPSAGETMGLWNLSGSASGTTYSAARKVVTDDFGSAAASSFACDMDAGAGFQIYDVASSPAAWQARLNGNLLYQTARPAPGFSAKAWLGADQQMRRLKGDIAEVLVYDHVLTDSERAQIHNDLLKTGPDTGAVEPSAGSSPAESSTGSGPASSGASALATAAPSATPLPSPSPAASPTGSSIRRIFLNNQRGDDRFDGLLQSATSSRQGPKMTLDAALASLPQGGEIVIQGTGLEYEVGSIDVSSRSITITPVGNVSINVSLKQRK